MSDKESHVTKSDMMISGGGKSYRRFTLKSPSTIYPQIACTIYPPLKSSNFEQNFKRTQHHALLHKGLFCERPITTVAGSNNITPCPDRFSRATLIKHAFKRRSLTSFHGRKKYQLHPKHKQLLNNLLIQISMLLNYGWVCRPYTTCFCVCKSVLCEDKYDSLVSKLLLKITRHITFLDIVSTE